jgi:hypothetical protein
LDYRDDYFYLKAALFLGVLALLFAYGTIHAAIYGGPIMPDDAWWFAKILFLILLPFALLVAFKRQAAFFLGIVASVLLGCSPLFKLGHLCPCAAVPPGYVYSVVDGKIFVPEDKRDELERDCGSVSHEGMKDSCRAIVYCQSWDALAYERMGCEELAQEKHEPRAAGLGAPGAAELRA